MGVGVGHAEGQERSWAQVRLQRWPPSSTVLAAVAAAPTDEQRHARPPAVCRSCGGRFTRARPALRHASAEESVPDPLPAEADGGGLKYPTQPPTIFIAMERGNSLGNAPGAVDFLRSHGVPSDFIEVGRGPRRVLGGRLEALAVSPGARREGGAYLLGLAAAAHARPHAAPLRRATSTCHLGCIPHVQPYLPLPLARPSPLSLRAVPHPPGRPHLPVGPHPSHFAGAVCRAGGGHAGHWHGGCRRLAAGRPRHQQTRQPGEGVGVWCLCAASASTPRHQQTRQSGEGGGVLHRAAHAHTLPTRLGGAPHTDHLWWAVCVCVCVCCPVQAGASQGCGEHAGLGRWWMGRLPARWARRQRPSQTGRQAECVRRSRRGTDYSGEAATGGQHSRAGSWQLAAQRAEGKRSRREASCGSRTPGMSRPCPAPPPPQHAAVRLVGMAASGESSQAAPDRPPAPPPPHPHPPQNTSSPAYRWVPRLRAALPWLRPKSRTMSLVYRTSLIQQALNVAWARHDAVAGGSGAPGGPGAGFGGLAASGGRA